MNSIFDIRSSFEEEDLEEEDYIINGYYTLQGRGSGFGSGDGSEDGKGCGCGDAFGDGSDGCTGHG